MIDEFAKGDLHNELRDVRRVMLGQLDDLSEYDVRRPLTATGTNLLGLIKHLSMWEARYLGEVFDRPFPELIPAWDDVSRSDDLWVREDESRADVIERFERVAQHADATVEALPIDAPGHVPWWPRPDVTLFNVLVHLITETNRHAGHADILREQLVGATPEPGEEFWAQRFSKIEEAARAADEGARGQSPRPARPT